MTLSPTSPPRTGMAITSLVLGLGAFLLGGPLLAIPAIILGFIARSRARKNPHLYTGRGLALTGILAGTANLLLIAAVAIFLFCIYPRLASTRMTADQQSIRHIAFGVVMYSNDYDGRFPPHLAAVVPFVPHTQDFVATGSPTIPPPHTNTIDLSPAAIARMDTSTDFIYIAGLLRITRIDSPSRLPLLYTREIYGNNQRLVAFADGHVETLTTAELQPLLADVNQLRIDDKQPPITLDVVPPPATRPW